MVFTDNATGSPQTVNLTGTGTSAGVGLSATILTFGSQLLGTSTAAQSVTLTNNGNSALSITSLAVTGANPGDFPETTTCGSSVAAGGSCTMSVTFTPTAPGDRTAAITITDSAIGSPQAIILTGTGTNPAVSLTASSLAFGNQNLGTTSPAQSVSLNNTGNATLNIASIVVTGANPGDFTANNTCGSSVAAGGNCTVSVTFTPASSGSRTASVAITDNASTSPQLIALAGTGAGTSAVASFSTTSLTFGSQSLSTTSSALAITLTNTGNATLTYTPPLPLTGANPSDFSESDNCGGSLAAGANCTVNVTFTPSASGTRTASLTLTSNASNSPQMVSLSGMGTSSAVSLSASTLTFATQTVGTTSTAQAILLTNTGNAALGITSLVLAGSNPGDFSQSNNCGSSVAAGGNCTINVTFAPTAPGTRTATVAISDNATGSPQSVSLTGTGGAPAVNLTVTSLTFGSQTLGTPSAAQPVTLSNTGTATLNISSVAVTGANTGDFAMSSNTCGSSVAAGANCAISVTFTPAAPGDRTASVTITDNAAGSPQTVSLTGTGTGPVVGLSASTLSYSSQSVGSTSGAQTVTLSNTGNANLTITSLQLAGTNAGDFSVTNTCGSSVAPGSCTISVMFAPTAPGTRTASLNIADNATSSPQTVSLTGIGSAPTAGVTTTSLTFSSQNLGTTSAAQTFTLNNTGNAALSISSIAFTGTNAGDFADTNNCGTSVAASSNCTVYVTFTPLAAGSRAASLNITDNSNNVAGNLQSVSLTGTATGPSVSLNPSALSFGSQTEGTTSTAQSITMTNPGSTSLLITGISVTGTNATDFAQTNSCGGTIAAAGTCTINVTFTPTASGGRTAAISIVDNAPDSPESVPLSGTGLSGHVSLSPSSLTFASQNLGTSSTAQSVTMTNTGNASFTIGGVSIVGTNSGDFSQTNGCGSSLGANASCTIIVQFSPTAPGSRTATVSITDNLQSSPEAVALTGTGSGPVASLSSGALTFASQNLGTTSAAQSVTLTNTGNASLTITSIAATGTNSSDFTVTKTCGSSLAANASCTISVKFTPAAIGSRAASVSIIDNAVGSPQTITLAGTGSAPSAGVTTTSLTFTSQNLGTTSTAQVVTLNNTGNAALTISSITFTGTNSGDFAETTTCGSTLASGSSCTFSVTFTPLAAGSRTASLVITDNSNDVTGSQQSVSLTGTGTGPVVSLSATSLAFGSQSLNTSSASLGVTLTNTGNASLTITSISVTGTNAGDFTQTNTCVSPVAANGTCTITVKFTPTAILSRNASVTITDNATSSPQTVTLTGTGTASIVSLSAATLTFSSQTILTSSASQTITLTNTGNVSLTLTSISVTGSNAGDFAETTTCPTSPSSVAASGYCTITITFTPSASGSRTASVSIADNATAGSPQAVSLIGTGITGSVGLSATVLTFGSQSVGTTSAAQTVTLTNGGTSALTITSIQITGTNPGDFAMPGNTCGSSVAVNATCTVTITFVPTTAGSRAATLTFTDSATNSPQTVSLTGTGGAPIGGLSPASFAFSSQPAATASSAGGFTLSNTGTAILNITSIGFTGTNSADFSQNTTCGTTLAASTTCTIAVTFTPAASGSRSGTLVVTDNSNNVAGSTQSTTLTGTSVHDVILAWTASTTSGILGYYIYRGTSAGAESTTPLNTTPVSAITYVDTNVTAGTKYYYVVTAVASNGTTQSAASNEASATVPTP
ncbi:MAG: choice-of-anchor D domain-containing protein [Acidobacteriota bacterium]|nr:choice-of-anchor D domain-containing protein [Acidobacteriota bacterium]